MATTIAYTQTFYSVNGIKYTIDLYDTSSVYANSKTFSTTSEGFTLTYHGEGDERYQPVKASQVELNCLVENSDFEDFLLTMNAANEVRFICEIKKGDAIYWRGILMTDLLELEDRPMPYVVKLTYSDGLGRLTDIPYWQSDNVYYEGNATLAVIIGRIMSKTGLQHRYNTTDTMFRVTFNWFDQMQQTLTEATIEQVRLNQLTFHEMVNETKTPLDCLTVLKNILTCFLFRIYQVDGIFYIDQFNEVTKDVVPYYDYNKNGTFIEKHANSREVANTTFSRANGAFTFLRPLRSVRSTYTYKTGLDTSFIPLQTSYTNEIDIGSITDPLAEIYPVLRFEGDLITSLQGEEEVNTFSAVFRLRLKLDFGGGSYYYLKNNTNGSGPYEWTTSLNYVYIVTEQRDGIGWWVEQIAPFVSPTITSTCDMSFKFEFYEFRDAVGSTYSMPAGLTYEYWCSGFRLIAYDPDEPNEQQISGDEIWEGVQLASGSGTLYLSASVDIDPVIIGDGPLAFNTGSISIYSVQGGNTWLPSEVWYYGSSNASGFNISELRVLEFMIGQLTPAWVYRGGLKFNSSTIIGMHNFADIDGHNMIFNGLSFAAGYDEMTVEMFENDIDRADYTSIDLAEVKEAESNVGFNYTFDFQVS